MHAPHQEAVDKMYVTAGVDEVCTKVLQLQKDIEKYLDATKYGR